MLKDVDDKAAMLLAELHGPLIGVPAWCWQREEAPEHWIHDVASLCVDLQARHPAPAVDAVDEKVIAAGLALRDSELLARVGHDIRSAWASVAWPSSIDAIRREVCWMRSERARVERDRIAGVVDLFDAYDVNRAAYRLRVAQRATKLEDDSDAAGPVARAAMLKRLLAERQAHDAAELTELIDFFTLDRQFVGLADPGAAAAETLAAAAIKRAAR